MNWRVPASKRTPTLPAGSPPGCRAGPTSPSPSGSDSSGPSPTRGHFPAMACVAFPLPSAAVGILSFPASSGHPLSPEAPNATGSGAAPTVGPASVGSSLMCVAAWFSTDSAASPVEGERARSTGGRGASVAAWAAGNEGVPDRGVFRSVGGAAAFPPGASACLPASGAGHGQPPPAGILPASPSLGGRATRAVGDLGASWWGGARTARGP